MGLTEGDGQGPLPPYREYGVPYPWGESPYTLPLPLFLSYNYTHTHFILALRDAPTRKETPALQKGKGNTNIGPSL